MSNQKRLYRSTQDRMFAGVCGGIAEYLDVDPTLVRLVFVALAFMGGPGAIVYIVLILVVPENPSPRWKRKRDEFDGGESLPAVYSSIPVPPDDESHSEEDSPPGEPPDSEQ